MIAYNVDLRMKKKELLWYSYASRYLRFGYSWQVSTCICLHLRALMIESIKSSVCGWSHTGPSPVSTHSRSSQRLLRRCPMIPLWGREPAKYFAFLCCSFQGKVLLSRISPHKPLNTSVSTANGLRRSEGNIYNYTCYLQQNRVYCH